MTTKASIHVGISPNEADGCQVCPSLLSEFFRDRCDFSVGSERLQKVLAVGIPWSECDKLADDLEHHLTINNVSDQEEEDEIGLMNIRYFIKLLRKGALEGRHVEIW